MTNGTATIQSTTDYSLFKTLSGNRPIYLGHLNNLVDAIREKNLLATSPIIVNDNMEVVDGQHRLKAAMKLKVPIYYIVLKGGNLSEVQLLNTNSRNWTTDEFLESYVKRGYKDYKYLKDYAEKHGFSIANSLTILTCAFGQTGSHESRRKFKNGDFVANQKEFGEVFAALIEALDKYLEEGVRHDRDFLKALYKVYTTKTFGSLLEKLKDSGWKIDRHVTARDYLRRIEDIINYRKQTRVKRLY